jgi:hypothetical protein
MRSGISAFSAKNIRSYLEPSFISSFFVILRQASVSSRIEYNLSSTVALKDLRGILSQSCSFPRAIFYSIHPFFILSSIIAILAKTAFSALF